MEKCVFLLLQRFAGEIQFNDFVHDSLHENHLKESRMRYKISTDLNSHENS